MAKPKNFQNYENQTFSSYNKTVEGCNITNCELNNVDGINFSKCNIRLCKITGAATFSLCNIVYDDETKIPDGTVLFKSNYTHVNEETK